MMRGYANDFVEWLVDFWKEQIRLNKNEFVDVNHEKLGDLAAQLAQKELKAPDWQIPGVLPQNHEAAVSHWLYSTGVNFASMNFEEPFEKFAVAAFENNKPKILTGSLARQYCFYRHFGEEPIKAREILLLTNSKRDIEEFFRGETRMPLLEHRRRHLREIAEVMLRYFADDAMKILEKADFRVFGRCNAWDLGVVDILLKYFPTAYGGDWYRPDLVFNKRAQLFALLYHGRAVNSGGGLQPLVDSEHIGPIADHQVPNGLRHLGIVVYKPQLAARIDRRDLLARHSREEFEIRATTVYSMAEILRKINEERDKIGVKLWTMVELDYYIWRLGQESPHPHHLTITTDY